MHSCTGGDNVLAASYSCFEGGLLFSNFSAVAATANFVPIVILSNTSPPSVDAASTVFLDFLPFLVPNGGTGPELLDFYFEVTSLSGTGGINGIGLSTGGNGATVSERACTTPINIGGGNICTGGLPNQLAIITNSSGGSPSFASFASNIQPVFIFKSMFVPVGGDLLSGVAEQFTVPEPMTLAMLGGGLVALGFMRRKVRKRLGKGSALEILTDLEVKKTEVKKSESSPGRFGSGDVARNLKGPASPTAQKKGRAPHGTRPFLFPPGR